MGTSTVHIIVKGKVQGVFFRASTRKTAERLGVTGWVRNTPEGDVEIMAQGTAEQLQQFTAWCNAGPPSARVETVEEEAVQSGAFHDFIIKKSNE